jgi:hypothetical protein
LNQITKWKKLIAIVVVERKCRQSELFEEKDGRVKQKYNEKRKETRNSIFDHIFESNCQILTIKIKTQIEIN